MLTLVLKVLGWVLGFEVRSASVAIVTRDCKGHVRSVRLATLPALVRVRILGFVTYRRIIARDARNIVSIRLPFETARPIALIRIIAPIAYVVALLGSHDARNRLYRAVYDVRFARVRVRNRIYWYRYDCARVVYVVRAEISARIADARSRIGAWFARHATSVRVGFAFTIGVGFGIGAILLPLVATLALLAFAIVCWAGFESLREIERDTEYRGSL